MFKWINELIDSFYFKRLIKRDDIGLGEKDKEWLKAHSSHQQRVFETMKAYILNSTFNSLTVRDHQRRKDWFDCLTALQNLCKTASGGKNIDYLTMKPKVENK